MNDLNSVTLIGRATKDPELFETASGMSILTIPLAFTTSQKDGDEWAEKSNFVDVKVFGKRAESLGAMIFKGKRVGVQGILSYSSWEKDGNKFSKLEVIGNEVQILTPKSDSSPDSTDPSGQADPSLEEPAPVENLDGIPF